MEREKNQILYLVIPCYNEQEVLPETSRRLKEKMESLMDRNMISCDSKIMFVNDGSKDRTWEMIEELHDQDPLYQGVKLSRNRGHQNALLGGLMTAKEYADMVISLDADLQDDIDVIDQFVEKYYEGCDIVYGVRSARTTDTFFKRFTAEGFYKIINLMGGEVVFNHADYRLMSKRALNELANYKEVNLFLRGIVPMIGFKTDVVTYERHERLAGESKYPLKKMLALAVDGITSLSIKPIRFIVFLGFMIFMCSILMLIYSLVHPKFAIPVHGEFRHRMAQKELAEYMGVQKENALLVNSGDVVSLDEDSCQVTDHVACGSILVDGLGVGDVGNIVLRDRQNLAQNGIIVVVLTLEKHSNQLLSGPDIVSRGFVYVRESEDLLEEAHSVVADAVADCLDRHVSDWGKIKNIIKDSLSDFLWKRMKRNPMILPIIMEV